MSQKSSIIIQLGDDREITFTPEEAKKVYQELGDLFYGQQQIQKEYVWYPITMPISFPYNPPYHQPYTPTCYTT